MVQPLRIIKKKDWFKKFSVAAEVDQTSNVNTETEFKPTIYHIPPDCIWRMDPDTGEIYLLDETQQIDMDKMTKVFKSQTEGRSIEVPVELPNHLYRDLKYKHNKAYELRRSYRLKKSQAEIISKGQKHYEEPPSSPVRKPKMNKAFQFRLKFNRREPILTSRLKEHYEKHEKPPFRTR